MSMMYIDQYNVINISTEEEKYECPNVLFIITRFTTIGLD